MNSFAWAPTSKESILLVDDSATIRHSLEVTFKLKGYNVNVAENGTEALMRIEQSPPDLVVLDVVMPDIDGYQVTRQIKQNSNLPFIPILLLTGDENSSLVKGLDYGASEFIRKPVDNEELLARVRAWLRLKHHIDEQAILSQRREDFVTHITHDLRTPLIAAHQVLQLLQRGAFGINLAQMRESIGQIAQSNETLLEMVDTLLSVYQYEAGCKTLNFFTIDLWELSQQVVRELKPLATVKGLTLKAVLVNSASPVLVGKNSTGGFSYRSQPITSNHTPIMVRGDRLELRRLLTNLIGNAIRFTDIGSVEIHLNATAKEVTIEVKDTGIGITKEEQLLLFDRFRQGNHQRRGNGLGLYLARQIVEAHQGAIAIKSEVGKGSIFTVSFPASRQKSG